MALEDGLAETNNTKTFSLCMFVTMSPNKTVSMILFLGHEYLSIKKGVDDAQNMSELSQHHTGAYLWMMYHTSVLIFKFFMFRQIVVSICSYS